MAMLIQQDISWLGSKKRDRQGDADDGEIRRDKIVSIGNNVGILTDSWLKLQFPLTGRKFYMGTDNERKPHVLVLLCCKTVTCLLTPLQHAVWKYYLHCSALFIEVLKLFPVLEQNICYIMATSPNRGIGWKTGQLKTWLIWIYGFEIKSVEMCKRFNFEHTTSMLKIWICVTFDLHAFFYRYVLNNPRMMLIKEMSCEMSLEQDCHKTL